MQTAQNNNNVLFLLKQVHSSQFDDVYMVKNIMHLTLYSSSNLTTLLIAIEFAHNDVTDKLSHEKKSPKLKLSLISWTGLGHFEKDG